MTASGMQEYAGQSYRYTISVVKYQREIPKDT